MPRRQADLGDKNPHRQAGFSVVELLITALILTIVLFAIYSMYQTSMTTATWGNKQAELQQNARVALDMIQREIRMAGYNPSISYPPCPGGVTCCTIVAGVPPQLQPCPIQDASLSSTNLTFIADIDGDNITDKVQYTFNSGPQTITRSWWKWNSGTSNWDLQMPTPDTVADGVSSLNLTYKDGSDAVTTTPGSVKKITIAIRASGQAGSRTQWFPADPNQQPNQWFASDVRLRNL